MSPYLRFPILQQAVIPSAPGSILGRGTLHRPWKTASKQLNTLGAVTECTPATNSNSISQKSSKFGRIWDAALCVQFRSLDDLAPPPQLRLTDESELLICELVSKKQ